MRKRQLNALRSAVICSLIFGPRLEISAYESCTTDSASLCHMHTDRKQIGLNVYSYTGDGYTTQCTGDGYMGQACSGLVDTTCDYDYYEGREVFIFLPLPGHVEFEVFTHIVEHDPIQHTQAIGSCPVG